MRRGVNGRVIGIVVAVYPEGNSIDVLLPKTGDRLTNVQCVSHTGSSNTGIVDLPEIGLPVDDTRWDIKMQGNGTRYVRAIIDGIDGMPYCMGFLLPQLTEMTFQRDNFRVERHASDVYKTINAAGDTEVYHPSGTYFRIGASSGHEDLTSQDLDKSWAIKNNTGAAVHVHLTVANAGAVVATIDIDPSGNVVITNKGDTTVTTQGNTTLNTQGSAQVTVQGTTNVTSAGAATVKAPSVEVNSPQSTFTGAVTVEGPFVFESGMTGSAGSGGGSAMTIDGDAHYTGTVSADTDVLAAGKSGKGHVHDDPQGGQVGPPI